MRWPRSWRSDARRPVDDTREESGGSARRMRGQESGEGIMKGGFDPVHGKDVLADVVLGVEGVQDDQGGAGDVEEEEAARAGRGAERDAHAVKVKLGAKEGEQVDEEQPKVVGH